MNQNSSFNKDFIFQTLEDRLPPFFTRKELVRHLGGLFTEKSLSNIESSATKQGAPKQRMGKKVVYEKKSFIQWFRSYFH